MKPRATEYYLYFTEWRVFFDLHGGVFEQYRDSMNQVRQWQKENCREGKEGEHYRVTYFSDYAAFLYEEDAAMCFLAFS